MSAIYSVKILYDFKGKDFTSVQKGIHGIGPTGEARIPALGLYDRKKRYGLGGGRCRFLRVEGV